MRYTEEQKKFIAENTPGRLTCELVDLFYKEFGILLSESQLRSYKSNHKIKSGVRFPGKATVFFREISDFIFNNYHGVGPSKMAELLSVFFNKPFTASQIKGFYGRNHLNCGITGRFEKGHVSANKGKPGKTTGRMAETQFKKGHAPLNKKEIGSERVNVDGYVEIKVAEPNKWAAKHVYLYESEHGKIPGGHCVIFGDGNKQNLDIGNLILITRAQHATLNRYNLRQNSIELTKTALKLVDLMAETWKRTKEIREVGSE
jgi:hypothetical protein